MSAAYDALIASPAPLAVILAEVQPMEVLGSWTAAGGGLTNTYYAAFASQIATSLTPGGLYRRLDAVRQNATALTSRASAALVDANLGSYFFDSAASRLYVSSSTGSSPETFALFGAWFTLFFSSASVSFSDQPLYLPLVVATLPTLTSEKPDPLFGVTIADTGNLTLANTDGLWDTLSQKYVWRNKIVRFKLGGSYQAGASTVALAYSDYATIGTMRINSARPDDELFTLELDTMGSILNKALTKNVWGNTLANYLFSGFDPAVAGQSVPVLFGSVDEIAPAYLGQQSPGIDRYGIVDASIQTMTVSRVDAVNRTTGVHTPLVAGVDWTAGPDYITVLSASADFQTYQIRAWVADTVTGPGGFGTICVYLLKRAGELDANINIGAFSALDSAYPLTLMGLYVTDTTSAADVLRKFEQSILGQVYCGVDGIWTGRVFDPSVPASYVGLSDADFQTWDDNEDLAAALTEVRVSRVTSYAEQSISQSSSSADATQYANETFDSATIDSVLRSDDQTSILANHMRFLRSRPPNLIDATMRGLSLMTASVGDLVSITRTRGPIARTGRLDGQLFMIQRIEKALGDGNGVPTVRVTLNDLEGQTDRIFRLAPSSYSGTWGTAPAADLAIYGFLGDTNRYTSTGDPTTKDAKVLW